jgi:hypothetical protein
MSFFRGYNYYFFSSTSMSLSNLLDNFSNRSLVVLTAVTTWSNRFFISFKLLTSAVVDIGADVCGVDIGVEICGVVNVCSSSF